MLDRIAFLGAGKMATAIAGGMVKHGFDAGKLQAYDCSPDAVNAFEKNTGIRCVNDPAIMVKNCDVVLLAVKPQYLVSALQPIQTMLADKLILSIVAGVKLEKLSALTGAKRIVRVMPNTPALVGEGCGAFSPSAAVEKTDLELAVKLLAAIGEFSQLPESSLDAVTALSGCGPAYVYELIQAMADGGVTLGLPRVLAQKLAAATVRGAAQMVLKTGEHPTALRDQVCSPGGATIAGVNHLAHCGFNSAVIEAEIKACQRSVELGK